MSSGFVSGGTVDNPTERDDEWQRAQAELEAARKAKADLAAQHNGKSLFEILQENKDKKQAEFDEKARYKLHVSLNDDEADYLDAIKEKKRKQEAEVRKDTQEQLDAFRRQQEEAERKALEDESADAPKEEDVQWAAQGRKRKKGPETGLLKGVKLKKSNPSADVIEPPAKHHGDEPQALNRAKETSSTPVAKDAAKTNTPSSATPKGPTSNSAATNQLSIGLGYTTSDDED